MIRIKLYSQSGSLMQSWNIDKLWTYSGGAVGIDSDRAGNVMLINGVYDGDVVGHLYCSRIEVETDYPITCPLRPGWNVSGNRLTIGDNGPHMIPAQSCLTIRTRWDPGSMVAPARWEMHGIALPTTYVNQSVTDAFIEALRTGAVQPYGGAQGRILPDLRETGCGFWRPPFLGGTDDQNGGGYGIEPISGYLRTPWDVIRADLVGERQRVWAVRASDGKPVEAPQVDAGGYHLTRGWKKASKLPRFVVDVGGDERRSKHANAGSCPYEARLTGLDFYSGFVEHNGEHMIRATRFQKAAAMLWGDGPAKKRLAMYAQECLWAYPFAPAVTAGQGGVMGREYAWVIDCLIAAGRKEAAPLVEAASIAQMANGQCMRRSYGSYNPVPDPWTPSPDVPNPFPASTDVASAKEGNYLAHSFILGAHPRNARKLLEKAFDDAVANHNGVPPRDYGVGTKGGLAFEELDGRSNPSNFDHWIGLGAGAWAYGRAFLEKYGTKLPTPTQGLATSMQDLKTKLAAEESGRSQCVAAMSALEIA